MYNKSMKPAQSLLARAALPNGFVCILAKDSETQNPRRNRRGFLLRRKKGFCPNIPNREFFASIKPTQTLLARSMLPNTFASLLATHLETQNPRHLRRGFLLRRKKGFCPNIPNRQSCASMKPTQALLARSALPNTFASLLATHLETQNPRHLRREFLLRRKKGFEPSEALTSIMT